MFLPPISTIQEWWDIQVKELCTTLSERPVNDEPQTIVSNKWPIELCRHGHPSTTAGNDKRQLFRTGNEGPSFRIHDSSNDL